MFHPRWLVYKRAPQLVYASNSKCNLQTSSVSAIIWEVVNISVSISIPSNLLNQSLHFGKICHMIPMYIKVWEALPYHTSVS